MSGFLNKLNDAVAQIQQPIAAAATPYLQKITETAQQAAQPIQQTQEQPKEKLEGFGQRMSPLEILLVVLLVILICSVYTNSKN